MYYEIDSSENFIEKLNRNNHKSTLTKLLISITLAIILFYILKPMWCYNINKIVKDETTGEFKSQPELHLYKMLGIVTVITVIIYYFLNKC
jgi:nitrogen fixation/metabolism regulation signal transduction histidine kinase